MEPREPLPVALERVRRALRRGVIEGDDDIQLGNVVVSLKDPYTYRLASLGVLGFGFRGAQRLGLGS